MATLTKNKLLTFCLCTSVGSAYAINDTIQGYFGGMSNQINSDIGDVPGNRYNGDARFTYFKENQFELERKFDLSALVNDQSLTMWSLQEAYVAKKGVFRDFDHAEKTGDQLKVGRQNLDWAQIDESWGLGKLNNRKNFDFFDPGQEGLVGLGYENKSTNGFVWKVFGSALYVPETNPGLDVNKSNNTIKSRNPWAQAPAESTDIEGATWNIKYIVDYPKLSDVIYRYSLGANLGWENKNWAASGYIMRKPENQVSTKVGIGLDTATSSVNAYITPEIYYHDVFGGNIKYRNSDIEMYVSGMGVYPNTFPDGNQQATTLTELKTEKRREAYLGGGISRINDKYQVGFNYIARVSPFDRELDSLAQDPRWNQAVNAFFAKNVTQSVRLSSDIKYDMLTTDRLVMLRAGYKVSKELLMSLGVNMIGTPKSGKSYWSPFTNNDALFAGLRYIF